MNTKKHNIKQPNRLYSVASIKGYMAQLQGNINKSSDGKNVVVPITTAENSIDILKQAHYFMGLVEDKADKLTIGTEVDFIVDFKD